MYLKVNVHWCLPVKIVLSFYSITCTNTHKFGETALHFAVDQEHEDIVELLLEAHADPDLKEVITVTTTSCIGNQKTMPYDSLHNEFVLPESYIIALEKSSISNH